MGRARRIFRAWCHTVFRDPASRPYLAQWRRSLRDDASVLASDRPWVPYKAADWLVDRVRPDWRVFEYGSGASTLFFARRAGRVVAVEHDAAWAAVVRQHLADQRLTGAEVRLVEPEPVAEPAYASDSADYASMNFRGYAHAIRDEPEPFDLVMVDGRARVACAKQAMGHVRSGGWLGLDNAERDRYAPIHRLLAEHDRVMFHGIGPGGVKPWSTCFWRMP